MALDGFESVVTSKTSPPLQPDGPEGELKVIMDHQDLLALATEEITACPHSLAAFVHEGLGLEQFLLSIVCKL